MTSSLPRAALSGLLLIALAAGCASRNRQASVPAEPRGDAEIENILRVTAPGLSVSRTPEGRIAVQIVRGPSSFYSSNEPLYVVDDDPYPVGAGGVLSGINPHDIASIKLLKNPAETGIYGIRGANGVIVIRTKRPGKGGG